MTPLVALPRGINVGGKNLIRMPELKVCFEKQGLRDVVTYIQSGNVLFSAPAAASAKLTRDLEAALAKTFNHKATLVLRNRRQLEDIVGRAPPRVAAHLQEPDHPQLEHHPEADGNDDSGR